MGASPSSLLLLLMTGAGCPAAHHLAPDLLHKLWVLLLHLLCKLLAPVDTQETQCAPLLLWAILPSPAVGPPQLRGLAPSQPPEPGRAELTPG